MSIQPLSRLHRFRSCMIVASLFAVGAYNLSAGDSIGPRETYPRTGYVWPYATGPYYEGVPAELIGLEIPGLIVTEVGALKLDEHGLPFPDELSSTERLSELGEQYFIVQSRPGREARKSIESIVATDGGAVVRLLSQDSLVARLTAGTYAALRSHPALVLVEPYHPALKLHPLIGRAPLPDPIRAASPIYRLDVMLWDEADGRSVADSLGALGVTDIRIWGNQLRVEAHRDLLPAIAALEPVRMIYEALPVYPLAEETTTTMQTGQYNMGAVPYHDASVDGGGGGNLICDPSTDPWWTWCDDDGDCVGTCSTLAKQVMMMLDTGIQLDAGDLSDSRVMAGLAGNAHRKVRLYETTNQFGGSGDLLGCDAATQGGVTHGHVVASVALGNATTVMPGYGMGWQAYDLAGNEWKIDGVAPWAVLVAYDGQVTPPVAGCADPLQNVIDPGDLYNPGTPASSSLGAAFAAGARTFNLSWGSNVNAYTARAFDIDDFSVDNPAALVVVPVGDSGADLDPPGGDGIPDPETMGSPSTTKNGLAIGASFGADTANLPDDRANFSSVGPAVGDVVNRTAPQLMAPGGEPEGDGTLGVVSEFVCRTSDNDQNNPVLCDVAQRLQGTSISSAAAAGAAMLVRDYFLQGFYPNRSPSPVNVVPTVSGALVKGILAASADFMTGANLTRANRWNNEQGYGRIQLDNALPLDNWPSSPAGLIVHDTLAGSINVSDFSLPATVSFGGNAVDNFEVCNDDQELRVVLSWTDAAQSALFNDLDLELTSPSGTVYRGNYFTDDNNRNGINEIFEDCPANGERIANAAIDEGPWSLPVCANSRIPGINQNLQPFDETNPIEGIFLSPDPDGNGATLDGLCTGGSSNPGGRDSFGACGNDIDCAADPTNVLVNDECLGGTRQTEVGTWIVEIAAGSGFGGSSQDFALVVGGGACVASSVALDRSVYTCNAGATVVVTEFDDIGDPLCNSGFGCTTASIEKRTSARVYAPGGIEIDCEGPDCSAPSAGLTFQQLDPNALVFTADAIGMTDATVPTPGNGVLDAREGDRIEVTYDDNGSSRRSSAQMSCRVAIDSGFAAFRQFGPDTDVLVQGGCERAVPRAGESVGLFEFGFPDAYMDADELVQLNFAFSSGEAADLENVTASLRCVVVDADSPAGCRPNGFGCETAECGGTCDPRRENNATCPQLTILDSPKRIGVLPANGATSANFAIQVGSDADLMGSPTVELVLEIFDAGAGKTAPGVAVSRQRLNVDEVSTFYNTDYPFGGIGFVFDLNNNELEDNPITDPSGLPGLDYRFETRSYGDLTATGRNLDLRSPWDFDGNDGGFTSGLASVSDSATVVDLIFNTGEDKNFNGIEDGVCLVDSSIACYRFPNDPRCPGPLTCISIENGDGNPSSFTPIHHSQEGGCGWQTRAPFACTADVTRSCSSDSDCFGTCRLLTNSILSTFQACGAVGGACPSVQQCNEFTSTQNLLGSCSSDADCGGVVGSCQAVPQLCVDDADSCDLGSTATTGGILHTGTIGPVSGPCDGTSGSQCELFEVISGDAGRLMWWELWLTPVIEKVDQSIGADGLPNKRIEIVDWAWNQSIDLPDNNVAVSWEIDTDVDSLFPVDLVRDRIALDFAYGPFGALTAAGDPAEAGGYALFAPMGSCSIGGAACLDTADCPPGSCSLNGSVECHVGGECAAQGFGSCTGPEICVQSFVSVNGSDAQGNNRSGKNSCIFEGGGTLLPEGWDHLKVAGPPDDDVDNDLDLLIDEFVTGAGPIRNAGISDFGGPDMRLTGLEDLYGPTGNEFQAAIGLINFEGTTANPTSRGYGVGIDDMVVEWREIGLQNDATSCATGHCATLEIQAARLFEGNTEVAISVVDLSPYNSACAGGPRDGEVCFPINGNGDCAPGICFPAENDCDLDGKYDGAGDDTDCDNDGTSDVVVQAASAADPAGETVVLNRSSESASIYRGAVGTSILTDDSGVLFLSKNGAEEPVIDVTYQDFDDGTGRPCQNDVIQANRGFIRSSAEVTLSSCNLDLVAISFVDNGDGDLFADTDETIDLDFTVRNECRIDLNDCVAQLSTTSPWIDCISQPQAFLGSLSADGGDVSSSSPFTFKVASTADRSSLALSADDTLVAEFDVTFACAEFDTVASPQRIELNLDLDVSDLAQIPAPWSENFESGTLGKFFAENLDAGIPGTSEFEGLLNGDGWRCQYNDPDWQISNTFGSALAGACYPGLDSAHADSVFWQVDGVGSPDGGRAKGGDYSLNYGVYVSASEGHTTPMGVVESVATTDPINLGVNAPQLSFWHQISLADHRLLAGLGPRRSADRAVVQIQLADAGGFPLSDWKNLVPTQNSYDEQASDRLIRCMFDPPDDGSTEDDFRNGNDPFRRLGPSSSCFPAFSFGDLGDTDGAFSTIDIGNALTAPDAADAPSLGPGTWVESVVDLSEYRGRRVRIRFLVSALKGSRATWQEELQNNPDPRDDGWWLDDIVIDETLAGPADVSIDSFSLGTCSINGNSCIGQCRFSLAACGPTLPCGGGEGDCVLPCPSGQTCSGLPPECGPTCTSVNAQVLVEPVQLFNPGSVDAAVPGQPITFDAANPSNPSFADSCLDGSLQYRFCATGTLNAVCDDADDTILRGWIGNPRLTVAPQSPTDYVVEVRCSTDHNCIDSEQIEVGIDCPGEAGNALPLVDLQATDKTTLSWDGDLFDLDVWISVPLTSGSQLGGDIKTSYPGSFTFINSVNSVPMSENPPSGAFHGYLVKRLVGLNTFEEGFFCNSRTWRSGGGSEIAEGTAEEGQFTTPIGRDRVLADPTPLILEKLAPRGDIPIGTPGRDRYVRRHRKK